MVVAHEKASEKLCTMTVSPSHSMQFLLDASIFISAALCAGQFGAHVRR